MTSNKHPIIQKRLEEYERGDRLQKAIYQIAQKKERSPQEQEVFDAWCAEMARIYSDKDPNDNMFFMYESRLKREEEKLVESLKDRIKKAGYKTGRFG